MKNIDTIMRELAQYTRLQEETAAIIDGLKDELKNIMRAQNTEVLQGTEHKASYKAVISSRIDTTALKKRRARNSSEIYPNNEKPPLYIRII